MKKQDKLCESCGHAVQYKKRYVLGEGQPAIDQQNSTHVSLTPVDDPFGSPIKLRVSKEMAFIMPKYRLVLERVN